MNENQVNYDLMDIHALIAKLKE